MITPMASRPVYVVKMHSPLRRITRKRIGRFGANETRRIRTGLTFRKPCFNLTADD